MVKFFENVFEYDYPFSAVSLAYFLRYPNPYATHVLSSDVIDRKFDPTTQRLTTTRLHLKQSKIPAAVLKLLPKGIIGRSGDSGQSYILETSVIDPKRGWMETESRNLEWTGILSVIEKQIYQRSPAGFAETGNGHPELEIGMRKEGTQVTTSVKLLSRFGQSRLRKRRANADKAAALPPSATSESEEDEVPVKRGFFASWSATPMQRSIEMIGLRRTREALSKSKKGMNIVLERLRNGGLVRVLEGMQQDKQLAFGHEGPWAPAWRQGQRREDED